MTQGFRDLFWRRVEDVEAAVPGFDAVLEVCYDGARFPAARDFALCADGDPPRVVLSVKLAGESTWTQDAVIRHELGHAVDFHLGPRRCLAWLRSRGVPESRLGPERRADEVAFAIWHAPIKYDVRDVQTLGRGAWPRPARLGR